MTLETVVPSAVETEAVPVVEVDAVEQSNQTVVRTATFQFVKPVNVDWKVAEKELRSVTNSLTIGANFLVSEILKHEQPFFASASVDRETGYIRAPMNDKNKIKLPKLAITASQLYHKFREAFPHVYARTASYLAQGVMDKYLNQRLQVLIGKASAITFRSFPITVDGCSVRIWDKTREDGSKEKGYVFEFALLSTSDESETPRRLQFVLNTRKLKPRLKAVLDGLVEDKKTKTVQIYRKNDKWTVAIPHKRLIERPQDLIDDRVLAVFPPGDGNLMQLRVRMPGEDNDWVDNIKPNFAVKRQNAYQARRREIGENYRVGVSLGGRGHGFNRAMKNKDKFSLTYRNSVKTMNQQWAAYIVKRCASWRCSKIEYICPTTCTGDNYNLLTSHPWYEFKVMLENKCKERGIQFEQIEFVDPKAEVATANTENA